MWNWDFNQLNKQRRKRNQTPGLSMTQPGLIPHIFFFLSPVQYLSLGDIFLLSRSLNKEEAVDTEKSKYSIQLTVFEHWNRLRSLIIDLLEPEINGCNRIQLINRRKMDLWVYLEPQRAETADLQYAESWQYLVWTKEEKPNEYLYYSKINEL